MKILLLGGYSNSGKSTTIATLRSAGLQCFSISEELHKMTALLCEAFPVLSHLERRSVNIALAEDVITPVLGRIAMVANVLMKIDTLEDDYVIIETIGGEEAELIQKITSRDVYLCNMRSPNERPGIDKRVLLPTKNEIWIPCNYVIRDTFAILNERYSIRV